MRHARLGRTGLSVSRLCLGTMTFGLQCDEAASVAILERAAAGGITFLDTADVYPLGGTFETVGRTEEILGRWLRGRRDDFVVATKCSGAMSSKPWDRGVASVPTTWTCTRFTTPIPRRRWKRRCGLSTTWCARAKRATSDARTT